MAVHPAPSANVVWQSGLLDQATRSRRNGHRGAVVWLTGLPGAGKSTLAFSAELQLHALGFQTAVLDGDNLRHGLCADLGFSLEDRRENMRRVGEVARLFAAQGSVVFVALVSPLRAARDAVRERLPQGDFIEVYCDCPLQVCQQRDPKGLYAKAAQGLIPDFTGVSSPYEAPLAAELVVHTAREGSEALAQRLVQFLAQRLRER
ncbi:adenylyl-sulfate kinase [Pantoea sp. 18069]|uniref:adenylyl-sulfate kinase n=1 Tax=Pantoea sp. 18069 TaxID=2681415 RepID=UPI00135A70BD|nr:adenylyl-sulfate kinase [Pantoea sp. 18069]